MQRLLSPKYRGLNFEKSTKRLQTDLRNNIFIVAFMVSGIWYHDSHLHTSHFSGNVHVGVASMIFFFKNMFTLNMLKAFYLRALSVDILVYILLFSIKLQFIPVSFFL